jgi:uncharacterized protein YjbI with pentapeptide repeats
VKSSECDETILARDEFDRCNNLNTDLAFITRQAANVLIGLRGPRPAGFTLDLSHTDLLSCDLKGADLRGANLTGTVLKGVNLEASDLSGITQFEGSGFYSTTWWRASRMDTGLIEHLRHNYPWRTDASGQPVPSAEIDQGVASLRRLVSELQK